MDEKAMDSVGRLSSMNSVKPHQPIYFPDEPSHAIFFLKEGHVKISRLTSEGNEMILDVIGPGEVFGELSLLGDEEQSNEIAQALDNVLICTMRREDFESLLKMNPELNFQVTKRIGLRLKKIEERVTDLLFKDVRKRIANFLVNLAEELGKVKGEVIIVKLHLSHQEIGLLTGSARQTVTTTLNEFRSSGLIDFSSRDLTIKDLEKLRRLSK
ncbi:MAG: Crp/Fnr family transcriptional regulator [Bacteroidota bacterium]|nr:Crp/Fnr family transcriptional regulator [Bacteroidota bacterium]